MRKYFRFNYQLLWSQQDQPAFTAFHNHFTKDEYPPFIINEQNEQPYFFKPEKVTKQAIDYISFDPRLITENNLHDDNRPYRYEQILQEQQDTFMNKNNDEEDNNNEEYILNQNENRNDNMVLIVNENNASEYTTPEPTTSAQNASQAETSTTNQFVRVTTRVVSPRQNTHNPQSSQDTSPNRYKTFTFPPSPEEEIIQDRTQNITNTRDISVMFYHLQKLIKQEIKLDSLMILHQFLLSLNIQPAQINQKILIITTNKLLVNFMIHLITPFFHHLIQILNQIILKMFLNLKTILLIL